MREDYLVDVLFSIKPCYAEQIFEGTKKYEFRKVCCRKSVKKVYVYVTSPICAVLGECVIEAIIQDSPFALWQKVSLDAGISEKDYFEYFRGRKNAVAYKLIEVVRYKEPKQLACFNLKKPPQSFCYI